MDDQNRMQAHCNNCATKGWHTVMAEKETSHTALDEHGFFVWGWNQTGRILSCGACERLSFWSRYIADDWAPDEADVFQYPLPNPRKKPDWHRKLRGEKTREIHSLVEEIHSAFSTKSNRLAMMGIRCAIDILIQNEVGPNLTFRGGLEALEAQGHLSPKDKKLLSATVEIGHAAAHRSFSPKDEDLMTAMDILEHLLLKFYILPDAAERMAESAPSRPPRSNP